MRLLTGVAIGVGAVLLWMWLRKRGVPCSCAGLRQAAADLVGDVAGIFSDLVPPVGGAVVASGAIPPSGSSSALELVPAAGKDNICGS